MLAIDHFIRRRSAILLPAWLMMANAAFAGEYAPSLPPPPLDTVLVRRESPPDMPPAYYVMVTAGTNKFAFPLADGFRMRHDPGEARIRLLKNDGVSSINLRITGAPGNNGVLDPASCRELLLARYPGAKILEEFSASAADHTGPGFDLQWKAAGGLTQSARVAFVPCALGILEFTLITTPGQFSQAASDFSKLLMSFHSDAKGSIKIAPVSDQS